MREEPKNKPLDIADLEWSDGKHVKIDVKLRLKAVKSPRQSTLHLIDESKGSKEPDLGRSLIEWKRLPSTCSPFKESTCRFIRFFLCSLEKGKSPLSVEILCCFSPCICGARRSIIIKTADSESSPKALGELFSSSASSSVH